MFSLFSSQSYEARSHAPEIMYEAQAWFNENLFEGKLARIPLYIMDRLYQDNSIAEYYHSGHPEERINFLASRFQGGSQEDLLRLAHEQVHQWQNMEGNRFNGHDADFVEYARAIGIRISVCDDQIIEGGAFEYWSEKFLRMR